MVGIHALLGGGAIGNAQAIGQVPGAALQMTADHFRAEIDGGEFLLTQEFLSQKLGVRRASVTTAARTLQMVGVIEYERGRISVTDRPGLEDASCECYAVVKEEYRRLVTGDA